MHDTFSIWHDGQAYSGRRYLRLAEGMTYQSVMYLQLGRCDAAGYANFADDDPAMNVAAAGMLAEMIDESRGERRANREALVQWRDEGGSAERTRGDATGREGAVEVPQ